MSVSEHTKGRLVFQPSTERSTSGAFEINIESGYQYYIAETIGGLREDEQGANARRMCAAWNACDGIGTDELEQIEVKRNMRLAATEYAALEIDRDRLQAEVAELREALLESRYHFETLANSCHDQKLRDTYIDLVARIAALIAKHTTGGGK